MEYIENYKRLFDMVSDLPDGDGYNSLMSPIERKETVDKPNENVLAPAVSGTAEVIAGNDAVADFDIPESQQETVKKEMMRIRNGEDDEQSWDMNASRVKDVANENVKKVVEQSCCSSANPVDAVSACAESKRNIDDLPEFIKIREIQPVEKLNPKPTTRKAKSPSDGMDDSVTDLGDDADSLQKFRDIVEKMPGMCKYTDSYKNRCAGLLCKYKDLPKSQFESLCEIMASVNK